MSESYVLYQFGTDPFNNRYEDDEGRLAFSLYLASESPNLVIRLARHTPWAQYYPNVMGPENAYYYFGPETSPGYIMYGNNLISLPMPHMSRQQREGSTSRYFTAQSGKYYKWRITPQRMECMDGRICLAVWEALASSEYDYDARLTVSPAALRMITEIMTTLILNRMYLARNWP
ncbi:hypothetical protein D9757_011306 [Collybiopsis confluens]|uniref:Uncharacterized protein n=1 Tax=Collybiopsis confluens TaxID=2823264 RepID=A0A8H5C7N6_9AGAR|nr:hypothetical protein D9757_015320 [Collybiopsis confluens]KAF5368185.1 hypothetical protein D9757_011306 [Collybiopsis confluens]